MSQEFSVYNAQCPSRNVLEKISDKWSILILHCLLDNTYRFGQLKREIGGISAKMLTQTLVKLERLGFIHKEVFAVLPMKVEYSLTSLGRELAFLVNALTMWTEQNMSIIMACENKFRVMDY